MATVCTDDEHGRSDVADLILARLMAVMCMIWVNYTDFPTY